MHHARLMLLLLVLAPLTARAAQPPVAREGRPLIKRLGTIDCDMVETTPAVFRNHLYRFEYVRGNYQPNKTGNSYFRFIDVATGEPSASFAPGMHLGCAHAEGDTMYVYGVPTWGASKIHVFWSKDLARWSSQVVIDLPGWEIYNTSVCKADGKFIMAFEVGKPPEVVGTAFTNRFAQSADLIHWKVLPEPCVYSKEKYTACPAIRFLDGTYYMIYLEARPGPSYESHIVRSKDLARWESSPLNPVLRASPEDVRPGNAKLTEAQRQRIATAKNINNSDVDLCEYQGRVIITYSWGNQQGIERLAEAIYEGTLAQFLRGWFPEKPAAAK